MTKWMTPTTKASSRWSPEISTGFAQKLVSSTIRGDQITLQFDDVISETLPRLNNFTLKKGSLGFKFKDWEFIASAGQVTLTSKKAIDSAAAVTLDYFDLASDQTTGVIQSKTGIDLASFIGFQINNQTTQQNNLTIDDADFEGNTINLYLNASISWAAPSTKRSKVAAGSKKQWDVVAKALEAAGNTSSEMYIRAKALALGKLDPMPTSYPEAPYSISAVAGWTQQIKASPCGASLFNQRND